MGGSYADQAYTISVNEAGVWEQDNPSVVLAPRLGGRSRLNNIQAWLKTWTAFSKAFLTFRPHLMLQILGYQEAIVQFAEVYPVRAWLTYDSSFRQSRANNPGLRWDQVDDTLFNLVLRSAGPATAAPNNIRTAVSRVADPALRGLCFTCRLPGHLARSCPSRTSSATTVTSTSAFLSSQRQGVHICYAYNLGRKCSDPCRWVHRCSRCNGLHPMSACNKQ